MHPLPADDLQNVVERVGPLWERLRGKRLMITGHTGFIGRWMTESVMERNLNWCWTGDPCSLLTICRGTYHGVEVKDDVRSFRLPDGGADYILHFAGPPASHPDQQELSDVIFNGTQRVCDFAKQCGARVLFASSGAAVDPQTNYGKAKRYAEDMVADVGGVSARIYATYGPGMNLDRYALGQFLQNGLNAQPIRITGDARTVRSWIYAADLAVWLWTMLLSDKPGCWPVGSEESMSLSTAAYHVAECFSFDEEFLDVETSGIIEQKVARYVPDTSATRAEFGVRETVRLEQGLRKTVAWLKEQRCGLQTTFSTI